MTRDGVLRQIQVGPTDLVVDIGGGHRPFPRADLVIEKHPFDQGLHRTEPMQFPRAPVIKADALAVPLPDHSCGLIFASHIIEHLPDPKGFISEIKRCSRRVYLEFPSRNRELMLAWSFHEWLVEPQETVLRFYRNDLPQFFGAFFHAGHDAALAAWSDARHEYLNTSVYCDSDKLQCEFPTETATQLVLRDSVYGSSKINVAESIDRPRYSAREVVAIAVQSWAPGLYKRLSRKRKRISTPAPLPDSVVTRLMCLRCRQASLRRTGDLLICQSCGEHYREDRGVFDFDRQKNG